MNIHKITLFVHDHEDLTLDDVKHLIESNRHLNVNIEKVESIHVPDWSDDHPTNKIDVDINKWWSENYETT